MERLSLLSLLKKKKGFFLSILDLTRIESSLSIAELPKVLQQKKTLLSCIEKIDDQIKQTRDNSSLLPPTQEVHEELEEIRSVIQRILETDKKNYSIREKELGTYAKNRHV